MAAPKAGRLFAPRTEVVKRHLCEPIIKPARFEVYLCYCIRCGKKFMNKSIGESERCYGRQ